MKPQSLQALAEDLVEAGFLSSTRPLKVRAEGRTKSIEVGDTSLMGGVGDFEESSVRHYLESLRQDRVSWLLFDGSIVQIKYSLSKGVVCAHRYCFIPAPFDLDLRANVDANYVDLIESVGLMDPLSLPRRTLLRFEYDPDAQAVDHPSSHLHVNYADCRLPVQGPLDVRDFINFLIRFFYSRVFPVGICGVPSFAGARTITDDECGAFHIGWRRPE